MNKFQFLISNLCTSLFDHTFASPKAISMRITTGVFIILVVTGIFSCNQKSGLHQVVNISEQNITSDEVYVEYLTEQIDRFPRAEDNYLKLAEIYVGSERTSSAIAILMQASNRVRDNLNVLIELGNLYMDSGNANALSATLDEIREIDPEHMEFLKLSAGYALLQKDYNNSLFYSNRAMLANPYDDENYYLRGSAQMIYKDSLSALQSFMDAYRLKDRPRYFTEIFNISMATNNYDIAFQYLSDYSDRYPDSELCLQWASYYRSINRTDTTKYILRNCLSHRPDEASTYIELANAYYNDRLDSSMYYVEQYLRMKSDAADGMVLKARILERRYSYSEARKFYLMAIEMDSTYTLAQNGLANLNRKVAYLRLIRRREENQRQTETLSPLNSKEINQ